MNTTSWLRLLAVAVLAIIFQVSVLDEIVIFGAHPDVMVLLAAAGGVIAGPGRGAMVGFVSGIFADLAVPLPFGLSALVFVFVGFGSSYLVRAASGRDLPAAEAASAVMAAVAGTVLYAAIGSFIGQPGMLGPVLLHAVVIVAGGAIVLAYPTLRAVRWVIEPSSTAAVGGVGI